MATGRLISVGATSQIGSCDPIAPNTARPRDRVFLREHIGNAARPPAKNWVGIGLAAEPSQREFARLDSHAQPFVTATGGDGGRLKRRSSDNERLAIKMDKASALAFLTSHSPMPDDDDLTQELIDQYDAACQFFKDNPDPDSIAPLLNSFGRWDGYGMYQLVEDAFCVFSVEQMLQPLIAAILSPYDSVRYWACQIAANFPCPELIDPLSTNLHDSHSDICVAAATALSMIADASVAKRIRDLRTRLEHPSDLELIDEILSDLGT